MCIFKEFEKFNEQHKEDPNYTEKAESFMLALVKLEPEKAAKILVKYLRP